MKPKTNNECKILSKLHKTRENQAKLDEEKAKKNPLNQPIPDQKFETPAVFRLVEIKHPGCYDPTRRQVIYFPTLRINCNLKLCRASDHNCIRCINIHDGGWEGRLKESVYKYRMTMMGVKHLRGNWYRVKGVK